MEIGIITIAVSALSSSVVTTVVNAFIFRRKNEAETQQIRDDALIKRVNFLDEQLKKMEKYICLRTSCKDRVL